MEVSELPALLRKGDQKAIARAISIVENRQPGFETILESFQANFHIPVVGFTGAPGAGKSSLVNALASHWLEQGLKLAVVVVDPASPFNLGSLLGDRIRMGGLFTHPNIFIRSISTRGSLGGLSAAIVEITDVFRNSGFDRIIIETVGVGQSEVEIAGVADITVVVTVPEGGDEIQTLKSGVMEIADVFVVNKCDREGADRFAAHLKDITSAATKNHIPVICTVATENKGISELSDAIIQQLESSVKSERRYLLLAEKVERFIIRERLKDFDIEKVATDLKAAMNKPGFNLYVYSRQFLKA